MPESEDQIDRIVEGWRNARMPAAIGFALSLLVACGMVLWALSDPSSARGIAALFAGSIACGWAAISFMAWRWSSRERYARSSQWARRGPGRGRSAR